MIADLLPRYYEANGDNTTYETVRSIVVDGHEAAWMAYQGKVVADATGRGREGEQFTGRGFYCECDFAEGVGWELKDGRRYSLDGERRCIPRKAALHLRHLELRAEYTERYKGDELGGAADYALKRNVGPIILDLIDKAKAGEFIGEDTSGAHFWGGHFYLQTVAAITGLFVGHLWEDVYELMAQEEIGLEGAVIQDYVEPPPPKWVEHARLDLDGWTGVASLPGHRQMAKAWRLEVFNPDGEAAYQFLPGLPLLHDPAFGPDVDDVERARSELVRLIETARTR